MKGGKTVRDITRIERVLNLLRAVWHTNPDMRFWQLVEMLEYRYGVKQNRDLFFLEDDEFEKILKDFFEEIS